MAVLLVAASSVGSVASAAGKKKIAILGIEATPSAANGMLDPADTEMAKQITIELRNRTKQGQGNYALVPGGDKELTDEKLMNNCPTEHPNCMSQIGQNLNADVLMFGKLDKASSTTYTVTLRLINVEKRQQIAILPNEPLPVGAKQPEIAKWAKAAYRKLTGEDSDGTLVVRVSNNDSGTVLVNEERKGTISSGSTTITLPEGRYRVAVEAEGFQRWEEKDVLINAGATRPLVVDLIPKDGPIIKGPGDEVIISRGGTVSRTKNTVPFKVAAAVGIGIGAVAGGVWAYSYVKDIRGFQNSEGEIYWQCSDDASLNKPCPAMVAPGTYVQSGNGFFGDEDCTRTDVRTFSGGTTDPVTGEPQSADRNRKFDQACKGYDRTKWAIPATIGFGLVGVGALIYLIVQKDDRLEEPPASATTIGRRTKKRREFRVTPILTPDAGGATIQFDW